MTTRPVAVLAAGALAGLAVGLVGASVHSTRYRAQASVIVAPALKTTDPALHTLTQTAVALVRTPAVADNVVRALQLDESRSALLHDVHAHGRPGTAIVDISADASSRVQATRVAQQVLVVFERLANARFGSAASGTAVQAWDTPASGTRRLGKPFASWAVGGASIGLLAAAVLLLVPRTRRAAPPAAPIRAVPAPIAPAEPEPEPETEPEPEREPEPREPTGQIAELRRRAEAEPDPGRQAEMFVYLDQLARFAGPDGAIQENLLGIAEEVFGPLT